MHVKINILIPDAFVIQKFCKTLVFKILIFQFSMENEYEKT